MTADMRTIVDWQNHNPDAALALIEGTAAVIPLAVLGATPAKPWVEFYPRGSYREQLADVRLDKHDSMGVSNQPFRGDFDDR